MEDSTRFGTTRLVVLWVVVLALLGGAGLEVVRQVGRSQECAERTVLRVTASPDIAPVVSAVARRLGDRPESCRSILVSATPSAEVFDSLGRPGGRLPDVWIPDSILWLTRAIQEHGTVTADAPSIATSPLVLTVGQSQTAVFGAARPSVDDLVTQAMAGRVRVRLSPATYAPERVGTLLALTSATASRSDARGALAAILRSAELPPTTEVEAKLAQASAVEGAAAGRPEAISVATMSEQAVWAAAPTASPLVAIYPGAGSYDYPYAVLSQSAPTREAAAGFLDELALPSAQSMLREAGFRDAKGGAGLTLTTERGVDGSQVAAIRRLDANALQQAEASLAAIRRDARLLAVVDVSGSMAWPLGGRHSSGPPRLAIALQAAATGMSLYPDTTEVALWSFSQAGGGNPAYREVVGLTTLGESGRHTLGAGLASLRPAGETALYETVLAAVRAARARWAPGRVNAVVVLSDGADTEGPMTLAELTSTLSAQTDPERPVAVVTIAFGPDADAAALRAISAATGGASYQASSAAEIQQVFLDAMGQRACRPNCS